MDKYGDFHDGSLEGFWVDNPLVHIFLKIDGHKKTDGAQRFAVVADGVVALGANGFREGHIVLAVETKTHEELSAEDIGLLYDVQDGEAGESQCQNLLQKAREQRLLALEITPSYGASFIFWLHPSKCLSDKNGQTGTARA